MSTDDRPADSNSLLNVAESLLRTLDANDPRVPAARNYELSALALAAVYAGLTHTGTPVKQVIIAAYLLGHTDAGAEASRLRADNVRLGDRNLLMAIAMQAAIEGLEQSLRGWQTMPLEDLPRVALLDLAPLRTAYDELVDALEGAAPTPVADTPANETCPGQSESVSAAEHVGERSCPSQ